MTPNKPQDREIDKDTLMYIESTFDLFENHITGKFGDKITKLEATQQIKALLDKRVLEAEREWLKIQGFQPITAYIPIKKGEPEPVDDDELLTGEEKV